MKIRQTILAGTAAIFLVAGIVWAQTAQRLRRPDSDFVTKAAQGGMAEVAMGRLAVQNGSDPAVKSFGQRMIDDHTKANGELKACVAKKGIAVPANVDSKQQATIDRLSKLNGAAFDKAYMRDMVKDHQEDVAEFQRESNNGADPDIKAFAAKTLPTLQEHLKLAQQTEAKLK